MRKIYKRLNEVFESPLTAGIFKALETAEAPWYEMGNSAALDTIYFYQRSGEKIISPMVKNLLGEDDYLSIADISTLATVLLTMYGDKWSHLLEALQTEYNPLENYDMSESGSDETNRTGTDTNVRTGSQSNSGAITRTGSEDNSGAVTRTGSESDAGDANNNSENGTNSIYGYNSNSAVPSDSSSLSASHQNTKTYNNVADTDSRKKTYNNVADTDTRSLTYNNVQDQETRNMKDKTDHTLTRHGNIGVTTSQQMLQSEIDVRQYLFFDGVMSDVDKFLTLAIY